MQLNVDEQSLVRGTDTLRKRFAEEKKRQENGEVHKEENIQSVSSAPEEPKQENVISFQFLDQVLPRQLKQNFYNLMQLVVRYGERPIQVGDTIYSIGEIIIYTIEEDEIKAPEPVYQAIIDEFKRHCKDEGFKAEDFFKFHPDQAISALAIDMIAEKYQYASFNHEGRLGELVTQFLYEIKLTVINQQIEELEQNLKEAQASGNWDRQMQLLAYQPQLLQARNDLCKLLGNRVINV